MAFSLARSVARRGWLLALVVVFAAGGCTSSTTSCPTGQTACGGSCVDLTTDPAPLRRLQHHLRRRGGMLRRALRLPARQARQLRAGLRERAVRRRELRRLRPLLRARDLLERGVHLRRPVAAHRPLPGRRPDHGHLREHVLERLQLWRLRERLHRGRGLLLLDLRLQPAARAVRRGSLDRLRQSHQRSEALRLLHDRLRGRPGVLVGDLPAGLRRRLHALWQRPA